MGDVTPDIGRCICRRHRTPFDLVCDYVPPRASIECACGFTGTILLIPEEDGYTEPVAPCPACGEEVETR